MDGTQEVVRGLVVARGNGAALLESSIKVFNQVTRLVQVAVIAALMFARGFWGNHHGLARVQQRLDVNLSRFHPHQVMRQRSCVLLRLG